jgi:hypothetical protein
MSRFDMEGCDLTQRHGVSQRLMAILLSSLRINNEEQAAPLVCWLDLERHLLLCPDFLSPH